MSTIHPDEAAEYIERPTTAKAPCIVQHELGSIPLFSRLVVGGDMDNSRTKTEDLMDAPWSSVNPTESPFHHRRLVVGIVGHGLFKFECTKQLVAAVFDALRAHAHAFEVAKMLHRDVSAGNIIITDEGKALLIDWELVRRGDKGGSKRSDRMGTWQFVSAKLLQHPDKVHTLTDDLESFLHVLGWMVLRFVPASDSYLAFHRGIDLAIFDVYHQTQGHNEWNGHHKRLVLSAGMYPSDRFCARKRTPLFELLRVLSKPFKSIYRQPPTDQDRLKVPVEPDASNKQLHRLWSTIDQYDEHIEQLQSPIWFIEEMTKILDENDWPTDDKADKNLPIGSLSDDTNIRASGLIGTSRNRYTHHLWENSKRAARSPTLDPSAKRRRGTAAASEYQA